MQLIENLDQTYCIVPFNKFFNSPMLIDKLFDKGIYAVRKVRSNRKQMETDYMVTFIYLISKLQLQIFSLGKTVTVKELFHRVSQLKESLTVKLAQEIHLIIFEQIRFLAKDARVVKQMVKTLKLL